VGAYSNAAATRFNGFSAETFMEVDEVLLPQSELDDLQG
jgi:hypothetical protein